MIEPVVIGDCTLYCGDCREVLPTLSDVDATITDPPYGINVGDNQSAKETRSGLLVKGAYDGYADTPENYRDTVVPAIRVCVDKSDRSLVFGFAPNIFLLPAPDVMGGIYVPAGCGRNRWGFTTLMPILMYGSAPDLHRGAGPTAFQSTDTAEESEHPTPKPDGWLLWCVRKATRLDEMVLDPFMGSGTTGVACVRMGRKFIGIEKHRPYFDIACRRIREAYDQFALFNGAINA